MTRTIAHLLLGAVLAASATAHAQSAQDLSCSLAAQDFRETCQKRIAPVAQPADPNMPTAAERKALDKHTKAWQGCKEKADKRAAACMR